MQITSKLRALANGTYGYWCPGCKELHQTKPEHRLEDFNIGKPTFTGTMFIGNGVPRCHHQIKGGLIVFFQDCRHKMKGSSVPIPDLPPEYQDSPRNG